MADSSYDLELSSTLVDRSDASVAIDSFASVILHESGAAMDLDSVVSILVAELRRETLGEWSESVGEFGEFLSLLAFLDREFAFLGDIVVDFINVDISRASVEESTSSVEFSLHHREDLGHGGELDDWFTELATLLGISESFAVGGFAESDALSGDAESSAIHEGHDILDKTEAARADEFGGGILVCKFASGATLYTHLIFDAAHIDSTISLIVDEHRETTTILSTLFRASEHEVDIGVAIGDETLHAIEHPRAILLLRSLEHNRLEV